MKSKTFYSLLFLIIIFLKCTCQTYIYGPTVSGHWTLAGSPYQVYSSVYIPFDSTLFIDPGVTVTFMTKYQLYILVEGQLLAVGTPTDTITFIANDTTTGWGGIRFDDSVRYRSLNKDTSKLLYCKIQYGNQTGSTYLTENGGALLFDNWSNAVVFHCSISHCRVSAAYSNGGGGAIFCDSASSPIIIYNSIINNTSNNFNGGGICCNNGSNPTISYNTIAYNSTSGYPGGGGGISCNYSSNPIISYNNISYNSANSVDGGGISFNGTTISSLNNNIISHNYANGGEGGGGIFCIGSIIKSISYNIISYNYAGAWGGGIMCWHGSTILSISYDTISNNTSNGDGGGIWCNYVVGGSEVDTISNTSIINNSSNISTGNGGGFYCNGINPILINVTFANNSANKGGALFCDVAAKSSSFNCIFWGDSATATGGGNELYQNDNLSAPSYYFCDVQGGSGPNHGFGLGSNFYTGTYKNNINANPMFVSPSAGIGSSYDGVGADWELQKGSPCIDAGDPSHLGYPPTDLAGNPRVVICIIDIGAYEKQYALPFAVASISASNVSCYGASNGSATASASGGLTPYTYSWSPEGGTGANASGLSAGTYTVTVKISNGCIATAAVTITQPGNQLSITNNQISSISCFGGSTGGAQAAPSGGAVPYSFLWSNGAISSVIHNLIAAGYTVTVTDNNGCIATASINITAPEALTAYASAVNNVSCFGGSNGSVQCIPSGGVLLYSFLWSNGATTSTINNLIAVGYSLIVTDHNGCAATASISITSPAAIVPNLTVTSDVSCYGGSNGGIQAAPSGGVPPYNYIWFNGATISSINNLNAGTYTITVTDKNGCSQTASISITSPTIIVPNITVTTNASCNGSSNGEAQVAPTGGMAPYKLVWSNGATASTISNLSAGGYLVTVTDNNGCSQTASITIIAQSAIFVNASVVNNVSCFGGSNGSVQSIPSGGALPYSFLWSNGASTSTINNLIATGYSLTVTDHNGCIATASISITSSTAIVPNLTVTSDVSCYGGSNGGAQAAPSGGVPPYNYTWFNGATISSINNLNAGAYTITVADKNGCSQTASISITSPTIIVSNITVTANASCNGSSNGAAQVAPTGGMAPYKLVWSNGATASTVSNLNAGTYTITVTDNNGCSTTASAVISQPSLLTGIVKVNNDVSCGNSNGSATVNVSGGVVPYSYSWNTTPVQINLKATGMSAGSYIVTIQDGAGCTTNASITISQSGSSITISTSVTRNATECVNSGIASALPNGGTPPYTYSWTNGGSNNVDLNLSAGNYIVTVKDSNGCIATSSVVITAPANVTASGSVNQNTTECTNIGIASVLPGGGTPPYTYSWTNGGTNNVDLNLSAGNYTVTVYDSNNCSATANVAITAPAVMIVIATISSNVSCNGFSNGSAIANISGGESPYTYSWNTIPAQASQQATGLFAAVYAVKVTDNFGCTSTASVNLTQPPTLFILAISTNNVSCNGESNGNAEVTITGGVLPITYSWSNGGKMAIDSNLIAGGYTVLITDNCNEMMTASVNITQPPAIIVTISGNDALCSGNSTSLTASGGLSYLWSNSATTSSITVIPVNTTTYSVTISNGICSKDTSITVSVSNNLQVSLITTSPICTGASDSISASGGTTYLWSTNATTSAIMVSPSTTTTYTVSISKGNCSKDTGISIIVNPIPTPSVAGNDSICKGKFSTLRASGGGSYLWSNSATTDTISISPSSSTYYYVTVTKNSCSAKDSIEINVFLPPVAGITKEASICQGQQATLTASGGTAYLWSNGNTGNAITVSPMEYTVYTVTISNVVCSVFDSTAINVNLLPFVTYCCDSSIIYGQQVQLSATGGSTYSWSPATGLSCLFCPNPVASPGVSTTYTLTITSDSGCVIIKNISIDVSCGDVFVPNVFSPGSLQNSILYVRGTCINTMDFVVYDRWGNKVFESNKTDFGWDGTFNGQPMSTATFVWFVKANLIDGTNIEKKGSVLLIR